MVVSSYVLPCYFSYASSVRVSDVCTAVVHLRPPKSVGRDILPGLIIKDYSVTFVPTLKYVFNLRLSQQQFSTLGRLVALAEIAPLFKKGNSASAVQFLIFFLIV